VALSSLAVLLFAVALAACGQVLLKHGMTQARTRSELLGRSLVSAAVGNPWLWLGLVIFGLSAVAWLVTLSRVPLSIAYPFNAMGYLAVLAASVFILHERANAWTVFGSSMVISGLIIVVTMSPPHHT
jgi:drug/metabolite transporter (DMT)-like permease